jgi:hypothetical protein
MDAMDAKVSDQLLKKRCPEVDGDFWITAQRASVDPPGVAHLSPVLARASMYT